MTLKKDVKTHKTWQMILRFGLSEPPCVVRHDLVTLLVRLVVQVRILLHLFSLFSTLLGFQRNTMLKGFGKKTF